MNITVKEFLRLAIEDYFKVQLYDVEKNEVVFNGRVDEAVTGVYQNCIVETFDFTEQCDIELNIFVG